MVEWISNWAESIIVAVIIATIIEMILPEGNSKKYIKVVIGVYVLFTIITPVINKFTGEDVQVSDILDLDTYIEEAEANGDERARFALATYAYIIAQYIGKYAVTMNGVDVITFTAGVGERGPETRQEVCSYLGFMGVDLDLEENKEKAVEKEISSKNSKVKVWVVPTDEELMIARETLALIQ